MPSVKRVGLAAASALLCLTTGTGHANAQGLLQSLFGIAPPQVAPRRPIRPIPPPAPSYRTPAAGPYRPEPPSQRAMDRPGSGSYRTLCVRMCDGYYWPISHGTSRSGLGRDANICRSSCTSEAKLFYHDKSSGDASTMVDLTGRAYARLPNAFSYRKRMVDGCKCKADPWSQVELDRHRHYAALASQSPDPSKPSAIAGDHDRAAEPEPLEVAEAPSGTGALANSSPEPSATTPARPDAGNTAPLLTVSQPSAKPATRPVSMPRIGKPIARATNVHKTADKREARSQGRRQPIRIASKPGPAPFGLGGAKLRWPGD